MGFGGAPPSRRIRRCALQLRTHVPVYQGAPPPLHCDPPLHLSRILDAASTSLKTSPRPSSTTGARGLCITAQRQGYTLSGMRPWPKRRIQGRIHMHAKVRTTTHSAYTLTYSSTTKGARPVHAYRIKHFIHTTRISVRTRTQKDTLARCLLSGPINTSPSAAHTSAPPALLLRTVRCAQPPPITHALETAAR